MDTQKTSPTTFNWFRKIAYIEGWSYLLLLGIAMPLKYFAGYPFAVKIVGALHGMLFVVMALLGILVLIQYKKNILWLAKAFIASIIPFGTFYQDREWKNEVNSLIPKKTS